MLSGYPQKLHEYLAVGRSIVASDMPELRPYADYLRIAKSENDFVRMLSGAIDDYSPEKIKKRVEIARQNTWEHRVEAMYTILTDYMAATEK